MLKAAFNSSFSKCATRQEVDSRFREEARTHHPDRGGSKVFFNNLQHARDRRLQQLASSAGRSTYPCLAKVHNRTLDTRKEESSRSQLALTATERAGKDSHVRVARRQEFRQISTVARADVEKAQRARPAAVLKKKPKQSRTQQKSSREQIVEKTTYSQLLRNLEPPRGLLKLKLKQGVPKKLVVKKYKQQQLRRWRDANRKIPEVKISEFTEEQRRGWYREVINDDNATTRQLAEERKILAEVEVPEFISLKKGGSSKINHGAKHRQRGNDARDGKRW
jgi:hypothetical protein